MSAALQIYYTPFDAAFFKLPLAVRTRIESRIDEMGLRLTTFPHHRLTASNRYRLRVGGYLSLANGVLYVAASTGQLHAYSSAAAFRVICRGVGQGPGRQFLLQSPSLAGKSYNVWFSNSLGSAFACVATNVAATPPFNSYQNTLPAAGAGYYRVEEK